MRLIRQPSAGWAIVTRSALVAALGSVIVDNFNFVWSFGFPFKTDAPVIVDADAVLGLPVRLQRFQTVSERYAEVVDRCRAVEMV